MLSSLLLLLFCSSSSSSSSSSSLLLLLLCSFLLCLYVCFYDLSIARHMPCAMFWSCWDVMLYFPYVYKSYLLVLFLLYLFPAPSRDG